MIISAFPGTGKTYLCNNKTGFIDSDSSNFSWSGEDRNPNWPQNYIKHIKKNSDKNILVSSHKEVREALINAELDFYLCYPHIKLKEEYIDRYIDRGSSKNFIDLVNRNWNAWINELENQDYCIKVVLLNGQYLSDIIDKLV